MRLDIHVYLDFNPAVVDDIVKRLKRIDKTMSRLSDEVQETRDAVTALTGRYQAKIDELQTQIDALKAALAAGDFPAATEAANALDALQTEMAALAQPPAQPPAPPAEPPAEPPANPEG